MCCEYVSLVDFSQRIFLSHDVPTLQCACVAMHLVGKESCFALQLMLCVITASWEGERVRCSYLTWSVVVLLPIQ